MTLKYRVATGFIRALARILNGPALKAGVLLSQELAPVRRVANGVLLSCPNELCDWRARTFWTKEPETLAWIDQFDVRDVLYDIGANVGLYTLYAAARGCRVVAFEPEGQNFALLSRNVFLNGYDSRVTCLPVALNNESGISTLFLQGYGGGGALNNLVEPRTFDGRPFEAAFAQGAAALTLDSLPESPLPFPTHIKIDVDGREPQVIEGGLRLLSDERLKSVLVEINTDLPSDRLLVERLTSLGFRAQQLPHSALFETGRFSSVYNYLFRRE